MRLVMTLLVRDEQDVLRANIDFHRAQGVDFFIVTDNKSEDSTPDIIRSYEQQGLAKYVFEGDDNYNQSAWVTRMARMAATDYGADWVINNDADEFWWPSEGNLHTTFAGLTSKDTIVVGQRHDFVALNGQPQETGLFCHDMVYRKHVSLNAMGNPLPPKVAHRAHPQVEVAQGNHWAELPGEPGIVNGLIDIFHFPLRSYAQFTNKIIKGGQAYERNTTHNANAGRTWRRLYKEYQRNGLVDYYRKQSYSPAQVAHGLRTGDLVADRRLSDYVYRLA